MSISTLSTINKYLLTTHGEPPPPQPQWTVQKINNFFPTQWTGLTTQMTNESNSDCYLNFTVPNQGDTWKNGSGYRVTVSSYLNTDFSARNIFTDSGSKVKCGFNR